MQTTKKERFNRDNNRQDTPRTVCIDDFATRKRHTYETVVVDMSTGRMRMESFWGKLKQEYLNDFRFSTRDEAKSVVFWYIEIYHRHYRLHENNGYTSPEEFARNSLRVGVA